MGYYRIDIKDGTETLINMNTLHPSSYQLRHITALSSEQEAVTEYVNGTPFSIVGPKAMLLTDCEVPAPTTDQKAKLTLTFPKNR
jgi:hypothetical protein